MTDTQKQFYASLIVNAVLNAFISFTAVTLNIFSVHVIRKTSSLPKTLKTLLVSLTVSDLDVGLLSQPFCADSLVKGLQKNMSGHCLNFIGRLILYASFFSITAIGVDRFLAVRLHLRYQELVTHKQVVAGVSVIWVMSAFLSAMRIFWADMGLVVVFILGFSFIFLTAVYCRISFVVLRHTNQIQAI